MKYIVAASIFVLVHLIGLYLWWLGGTKLERGYSLAYAGAMSLVIGGYVAGIVLAFWKNKK